MAEKKLPLRSWTFPNEFLASLAIEYIKLELSDSKTATYFNLDDAMWKFFLKEDGMKLSAYEPDPPEPKKTKLPGALSFPDE